MQDHERYKLLARGVPGRATDAPAEFVMYRDDRITVLWAPFDFINARARLVMVGITPGWQQLSVGYEVAAASLADGLDYEEACRRVKLRAAFAGSMRENLVRTLDDLGLAKQLEISSTGDLFSEEHRGLMHTTAALRYPVFTTEGRNYTGQAPKALRHPELRRSVESVLADEVTRLERPLIVPLGKASQACIEHALATRGASASLLRGFPHPSGANGHRAKQFAEHRDAMAKVIDDWAA